MSCFEHTLKEAVRFRGVGLHTGSPSSVTVHPAEAGTGIVFVRTDVDPGLKIPAVIENVNAAQGHGRQTMLSKGPVHILTIEHLMAAFHGLGVDNALVEISGEELPGLDGSALEYIEGIEKAGLVAQNKEREVFVVRETMYIEGKNYSMTLLPAADFQVSYTLSYGHEALADQFVHFQVSPATFKSDIASARTFCLKEEADALLSQGYGKGANLQNTLVFQAGEPIGNSLRFKDEAARHKVLDLIGDLYLLGKPIRGHVITFRTGHRQNYEMVKKISDSKPSSSRKGEVPMSSKQELNIKDIQKVIPHRYPFLLIDKVLDLEPGKRAVGIKNVTANEPYFQGHFPKHPIMPGVLIIEAMAQVGGVVMLSMYENHGKNAYFMSIDNAKFRQPVYPGDTLRLEVEVMRSRSKTGQCSGRAYVGTKLVCEAEVKFAVVDAEEAPQKKQDS